MADRKKTLAGIVLWMFQAALCVAGVQAAAQIAAQSADLQRQLPVDPEITIGTLDNGLRYYIRTNGKPEKRAELRLVVNAGSVLENENQLGLAHFVEHMAFNGTSHFAKQEIVDFMESIGMQFGPSLNASTSFDETVYQLEIPTDRPELMDKAFLILEDWAHNLTFDPVEIDKERGVIIEEWRQGRGAAARMRDKQFPILFQGSRYAERLPIGQKQIIESFKPETLKQFYRDWYRPDLMAVVAVGDFDRSAVENLIRKHFGAIPSPATERPRPTYDVPDHSQTLYAIATDKEATTTSVGIYEKLPVREQGAVGEYRRQMIESLYTGMLNRRFSELSQKPDPPFVAAGSQRGLFVRSKDVFVLNALVNNGGVDRGLDALVTEFERVARYGFTAAELERQKQDYLRSYEHLFAERDQQESSSFASEYARNFLQGEPIPGIAYEYELWKRYLPGITLEEVNRMGKGLAEEGSRVVMVSAPQKQEVEVPDETELASVMRKAAGRKIEPYVDTLGSRKLLETLPEPGKVVETARKESLGITEWHLSNGVKVILKPTDFKEDEIVFRAFSPGGTSLASDPDYIPASTAAQVVSAGGLGQFSAIELTKLLSGKVASVRPFIGDTEEGLSGGASPKDLETMFQLIYLTFTEPRADANIFKVLTSRFKAVLANRRASPEAVFGETLQTTLTQNHYRARPMTPEIVDEMNLEKSLAFYRNRFADASDFTFLFVGNIDPDTMKPLVERYLGSLPSMHRGETWKDEGIQPPKGVVVKSVEKGIEPKSRAAIVFTGPFRYDPEHRVLINALSMVLSNKLRETLREDLGGTYGVGVSPSYAKIPEERYSFSIGFGCDPGRVDELVKTVFREIADLKANGPSEQAVADVREALAREYETDMKRNDFLLAQLAARYRLKEDPASLLELPKLYSALTPGMIRDAARTILDTGNYVEVTLLPEKQEKQGKADKQENMEKAS